MNVEALLPIFQFESSVHGSGLSFGHGLNYLIPTSSITLNPEP